MIDSAPQPGGWTRTARIEGFSCELGPQAFRPGEHSDALIGALGIQDSVLPAEASAKLRFIGRGGTLRPLPMSPGDLRRTDLFNTWGKLRLFLEPLCFNRSQPGESLAGFVARRFGSQAQPLAGAMARGVFGGDASRLEARSFSKIVEMEAKHGSLIVSMIKSRKKGPKRPALCTFKGGMEDLISALRRELGSALVLGRQAVRVLRQGDEWQVTLGGEVESTITARELTLATPAHASAKLLADLDPELSSELAAIPFASVANVYLGYWESDVRDTLQGFGFLLEPGENTPVLGILYCSAIFPGRAVPGKFLVRAMIGGVDHADAVDLSDEDLVRMAQDALENYAGVQAPVLFQRVRRAMDAIPQYEIGHADRVERIRSLASRYPGLRLCGNSYDDVSLVGQMGDESSTGQKSPASRSEISGAM